MALKLILLAPFRCVNDDPYSGGVVRLNVLVSAPLRFISEDPYSDRGVS